MASGPVTAWMRFSVRGGWRTPALRRLAVATSPLALLAAAGQCCATVLSPDALAGVVHDGVALANLGVRLDPSGPVGLLVLGLTAFSTAMVLMHLRARRLWNEHFEHQRARVAELQTQNERMEMFLAADPQVLVNWDSATGEPSIEGDPAVLGEGIGPRGVTRFGDWLGPAEAASLHQAVDRLRNSGEAFALTLDALSGAIIEVSGRPVAGRAIMRFRAVTGERQERERLAAKVEQKKALLGALKGMLDAISLPVWLRDRSGRLVWVNAAYVRAVEARDSADVAQRGLPLVETSTQEKIEAARAAGQPFRAEVQAIVAGDRRTLDVMEVLGTDGRSGGIAVDVTELDNTRRTFGQQNAAHVRTLDQLQTAVVLFDQQQRLAFTNRAFNELWQLDRSFVESRPSDGEMLDRLRADGKLPEHANFREWKLGLQQSLNANETLEDIWLLPSGRSIRVVVSPSTVGGVTYLFDDITEQMNLAQNYNRLASMQGETLDSLTEGVAVFGSNGRLQLHNPAFYTLWGIAPDRLARTPHFDEVARLCPPEAQPVWADMRSAVCGLPDERISRSFQLQTAAGKALALVITPLPEGASLLTVEDVTATVSAARILKEKNEVLEQAAKFRSEFINNVSFELRLPLTSVVGISQMLAAGTVGPLNERQLAYTNDLVRSTDAVLALINDILALTSIESTELRLAVGGVDLHRSIDEATEGLKDRLGGAGVSLHLDIAPETGTILGDAGRIRQIMFNLIANAIAYSDPGDRIVLHARRASEGVEVRITDRGAVATEAGLPGDTSRRYEKGNTLRLSVVRSLVELHHGRLTIQLRADGLREVICTLPAASAAGDQFAA